MDLFEDRETQRKEWCVRIREFRKEGGKEGGREERMEGDWREGEKLKSRMNGEKKMVNGMVDGKEYSVYGKQD